jgi:hypothetical protein
MKEVYTPYCRGGRSINDIDCDDNCDSEVDGVIVESAATGGGGTVARAKLVTVYIDEAHATDEW